MALSPRSDRDSKLSVSSLLVLQRRLKNRTREPVFDASADRSVAIVISKLLRAGILISTSLVLVGGIFYLGRYGTFFPSYREFIGEPIALRNIRGIVLAAFSLEGRGLIQLGLLVLLATPLARVAVALVGFYRIRDRFYVAVAGIVLGILLFSFISIPS